MWQRQKHLDVGVVTEELHARVGPEERLPHEQQRERQLIMAGGRCELVQARVARPGQGSSTWKAARVAKAACMQRRPGRHTCRTSWSSSWMRVTSSAGNPWLAIISESCLRAAVPGWW